MIDLYKKISNFWIESISVTLTHHNRLLDFHQQHKDLMNSFYEAWGHTFHRLSMQAIYSNTDAVKAEYRQYIEKITDLMIKDFDLKVDFAKSHSINLEKVVGEYKQSFYNLFEHVPLMNLYKEASEKSKIHDFLKESSKKTAATMIAGVIAFAPEATSSETSLTKQRLNAIHKTLSDGPQQMPIDQQERQLLVQEILRALKKLRKKRGTTRILDLIDDEFDALEKKITMLL